MILNMLDKMIPYEENMFFAINGAHSNFLDGMMWLFSGFPLWIFPLAVFIFILVHKVDRRQWIPVLLAIILVFVLCDQFSSHLIKPLFQRERPTHYPEIMEHVRTLYGYRGGRYGFISGHATNSFGFALFTSLLLRNKFYTIFIIAVAFVISYSRIYLGVHFISDVVSGIAAGISIGYIVYKLYSLIGNKTGYYCIESHYKKTQINRMTIILTSYLVLSSLLGEVIVKTL